MVQYHFDVLDEEVSYKSVDKCNSFDPRLARLFMHSKVVHLVAVCHCDSFNLPVMRLAT